MQVESTGHAAGKLVGRDAEVTLIESRLEHAARGTLSALALARGPARGWGGARVWGFRPHLLHTKFSTTPPSCGRASKLSQSDRSERDEHFGASLGENMTDELFGRPKLPLHRSSTAPE
jgi:hypothetical protein